MIYYKLTCKISGRILSFNDPLDNVYSVEYKLNEWVYPKYSFAPLMVFDNLKSAQDFSKGSRRHLYIYECEIKKSKKKWGLIDRYYINDIKSLILSKKKFTNYLKKPPNGTVFADSVKIIKIVKEIYYGQRISVETI